MLSSECSDDKKKREHIKGTAVTMSKKTVSAVYVFSCFAHGAHCERLNTDAEYLTVYDTGLKPEGGVGVEGVLHSLRQIT